MSVRVAAVDRELRYATIPGQPLTEEKRLVLERVSAGSRVLEIGAHTGDFSAILTQHGCRVTAVEANASAASRIGARAAQVIAGDIEDRDVQRRIDGRFDVVLAMHVLEHLADPWQVLRASRERLEAGGTLIALIPNVAAWSVRKDLFFRGRFDYEELGLLDRTHLRFFTVASGRALIESSGFRVTAWAAAHSCVPLERRLRLATRSNRLAGWWSRWMTGRYPNLTTEISLFAARPTDVPGA